MSSVDHTSRVYAFWQPGLKLWMLRAVNGGRSGQLIAKMPSPVSLTRVDFVVDKNVHAKAVVSDHVLFHASCRGDIVDAGHVNFETWDQVRYNLKAGVLEKADGTVVTSARDAVCAEYNGRPCVWIR